jgi:hypothetical protein
MLNNTIENMLKKADIRYIVGEGYPEDLNIFGFQEVIVLPDYGTIFDAGDELTYNSISELNLMGYEAYQVYDQSQVSDIIRRYAISYEPVKRPRQRGRHRGRFDKQFRRNSWN